MVNFGPVTPKFKRVKGVIPVVSFFKINFSDKLSYYRISTGSIDDFNQILSCGRYLIIDYLFVPFSQSLKGRCHGNQL